MILYKYAKFFNHTDYMYYIQLKTTPSFDGHFYGDIPTNIELVQIKYEDLIKNFELADHKRFWFAQVTVQSIAKYQELGMIS